MSVRLTLIGICALAIAAPSLAADRMGYVAIAAKDYGTAEKRLETERRIHPGRPELMLNMAEVYRNTGRNVEARTLYREVLARPVVDLDVPSGASVSSHDLAAAGLERLGDRQIVAR